MATRTITTKLAIEGEAEYRAKLKNLGSELALYRSELQKVIEKHREDANSLTALQEKKGAQEKMLGSLNQKHQEQAAMLEKARSAQQLYAWQVEQSSGKLERAKAKLEELKQASGDTAQAQEKLKAEIEKHAQALAKAEENQQKAANAVRGYETALNNTERDQAKLSGELEKTKKYLDEAEHSASKTAQSIDKYGNEVGKAGKKTEETDGAIEALAGTLAASGVSASLDKIKEALMGCVNASVAFESAMAGARRTLGGSQGEMAALGDAFQQLSLEIPISAKEMGKIAESAGQLGIGLDSVEEFSTVMAKLGTTTDLTADSAATMLAQFANITGLTDFERLGSTVAALGDSTATTASKVVEMAQGMAAAADMAGMSETDILAIAAAVGSLGIEAQAGSTAMSTLIQTLFKSVETGGEKLEAFASVAGMSAEGFSAAWRENAASAMESFLSGLNDVERNGKSAIVLLDELGITNARQVKAILGLANAEGLLSGTIAQASAAWEENTALGEKAAVMYDTTEAKLAMFHNSVENLQAAVGDALTPALSGLAEAGTSAFAWAADFVEQNPWLAGAITGIVAALGLLAGGLTTYIAVTTAATLVTTALGTSLNLLPFVGIVTAIGAVVGALATFVFKSREAKEEADGLSGSLEETGEAAEGAGETADRAGGGFSRQGKEMKRVRTEGRELVRAQRELQEGTEELTESQELNASAVKALSDAQKEARKATDSLTAGAELLDKALKEQSKSGQLSLDTALDIIDAGYAAALSIDTETGAVTLNREEYIRLAQAQLEARAAELEAAKTDAIGALDLKREAAEALANANYDLAISYYASASAEEKAAAEEGVALIASFDAQIAALRALQSQVGSYTGTSVKASKTRSSAAKKEKTQAEKDLADYKSMTAELEHLRAMDAVSERDYYDALARYRDQFLTDDANVDEYRKVTEKIYDYDKSLGEQEAKLWAEQTETMIDELKERFQSVLKEQEQMEEKLAGYGDLFSIKKAGKKGNETEIMELENLQKQVDAVDAWGEALGKLKDRGISGSLMDEVLNMDVDEATQYAGLLLQKTDEQWEEYNSLWEEKQQRAAEIAEEFFKDELDSIETDYNKELGNAFSALEKTARDSGSDVANGLIEGLQAQEGALYAQAEQMVRNVSAILASAGAGMASTFSPSNLQEPAPATARDVRSAVSGAVNGLGTMMTGGGGGDLTVPLIVNGREIATATLPDFRFVSRANPEVKDDR